MATSVPASVRYAAAKATLQFDWLPEKPFFRVGEVASLTNLSSTKVEEMFAEHCHRYPAGKSAEKKRELRRMHAAALGRELAERERPAMQIPRVFVVEALVESARYTTDDLRISVASCFRGFGIEDLLWLQQQLGAEIRRKGI